MKNIVLSLMIIYSIVFFPLASRAAVVTTSNNGMKSTQDVMAVPEIKSIVQCFRITEEGCCDVKPGTFMNIACLPFQEAAKNKSIHSDARVVGINQHYNSLYITWGDK